jgi:hypothetical protein
MTDEGGELAFGLAMAVPENFGFKFIPALCKKPGQAFCWA